MVGRLSRLPWVRIVFAVVGGWAIVIGGALVVAATLSLAGAWELALLFGLVGGAATVVLGALVLTHVAVRVRCDPTGLHLPTVGRHQVVPWSRVVGYRTIGVQRGIKRLDERSATGPTFVVLDYRPPGRDGGRPERVYFWVTGTGPASATSTEAFATPLDTFIRAKRRDDRAALAPLPR
jgi:hypothetical protein